VVGGLVVIGAIIGGTHSGSNSSSTDTTSSPALVGSTSSSSHRHHKSKPQTFKGHGTENIGTVAVHEDSTLRWHCASCGSDNFQVFNDPGDGDLIAVNGLNQTSGKTVINTGTYHKVLVNTEGEAWTIRITSGT
jgi:hypothetical protein